MKTKVKKVRNSGKVKSSINTNEKYSNTFLNDYENIIVGIVEKIAKDQKSFYINGQIEIPHEMGEFLSKVCKRDFQEVNLVFKRIIREMNNENIASVEEKVSYDSLNNMLKDNNNQHTNTDLNLKEFLKKIGWNENKFYKNIGVMCSKDVYDIDIGNFRKAGKTKEDYFDDEKNFLFKKEWNDLAILLFKMFGESPFFRSNSKATSASLDSVVEYNNKFLKAVENEINTYNSLEIRMHPVYYSTKVETLAMEKVKEKIQLFFSIMSEVPIESRANMWLEISNRIDEVIIKNYVWSKQAKEEGEKDKGELFKTQIYGEYEHTSLDKYIAQVLKNEMNSDFTKERLDINKEIHKWKVVFDKVAMILDGEENVNNINELWEKNNGEKKKIINKKYEFETQIENQLKEKENLVNKCTDINRTIDIFIQNQIDCGHSENVDILKELKCAINKKDSNNSFKPVIENVIQQVNFNVMNRK